MKKVLYSVISCVLIGIVTAIGYVMTYQPSSSSSSTTSSSSAASTDSSKYKF